MKTNKFFRSIAFTIILVCVGTAVSAQVTQKIGGNPFYMEPSAVLELESTTKGFLLPRMLKSEMNAIASPPAGMMVYCTDCGGGIGQLRVRYGSTTAGSWGIPSINLSGDVHASVDPTTGSNGTVIQSNVVSYAKMQTVTANTILGNGTNATGNVQEIASTGTGNVVRATSPILTSPTITGTGAIAGTFTGDITGDVIGNVTGSSGSTTGNAATATALATARTIGGVSFNGTANINLPGVNEVGNQNTSGNAATATKIASITNTNIVQLTESQTLTNKRLMSPDLETPNLGVATATQITSMLGFRVAGSFAGSLAGSQGLYIAWDSWAEETTSFINVKGSGAGGFSFFNEDADSAGSGITPTPIVQITPVGEIKAGDVTYTNTTGTNGQVLTSNGAGETSWETTTNANLTGVVQSSGNTSSFGTFSSGNLQTALTDETGTGAAVFSTSPTLVTPSLGVASATSLTANYLTALGNNSSITNQGAYMMWNASGVGGETSFVNSKGGGAGGFSFFNVTSGTALNPSATPPIVAFSPSGEIKAGDVIYTNTTGTNGQVLTSNGAGETSWTTISVAQTTYVVGTSYAELGGTVIQLSQNGKHGLVAADQDQGLSTQNNAENLANDPTLHDVNGKQFLDWRVPTKREAGVLVVVMQTSVYDTFWSSTFGATNNNNAWCVTLSLGIPNFLERDRYDNNNVRAVRAF
jgi:hypothetical protein